MVKNRFDPPFLAMMQNDDDFRSNKFDSFVLYTLDVRIPMDGIVLFSTCKNPLTRIVNIPSGGPKKKKSVAGSRVSAFLH